MITAQRSARRSRRLLSTVASLILAAGGSMGCASHRSLHEHCARPTIGRASPSKPSMPAGRWSVGPQQGRAQVSFSFPPPHDSYAGEVLAATGWVQVDDRGRMRGRFAVRAADVDMGEADLTENVRYAAEMLSGEEFPEILYEFSAAASEEPSVLAGHVLSPVQHANDEQVRCTVAMQGTFRLKGVQLPLSTPALVSFLPLREGTAGAPGGRETGHHGRGEVLNIKGTFELHGLRERFHISGPGGEDDATGNRLLIVYDFQLPPAAGPE